MVFYVKINKQRLMSDGAAIGLDIAGNVLSSIFNNSNTTNNSSTTKTQNISFTATLIDGASGTTISKLSEFKEASWNENPQKIIVRNYARMIRKIAVFAKK
jgi:hypothetical protein